MRTTLTIEPAITEKINRIVSSRGRSMKEVVNEALREGLKAMESEARPKRKRFKVEPHDFGFRPGIDLDRIGRFADEIGDEEIARALRGGRK